jgi:hypothetical protein
MSSNTVRFYAGNLLYIFSTVVGVQLRVVHTAQDVCALPCSVGAPTPSIGANSCVDISLTRELPDEEADVRQIPRFFSAVL